MTNFITEEDVRTKLVYPWLRSIGISSSDITLEETITFQLGRGEFKRKQKSGRIDLLVKSSTSGMNLIVVEVKSPNVKIDDEAINQAVSYARILKGNMAPIVVLTNSNETKVFCSLTKKPILEVDVKKVSLGEFHFNDNTLEGVKSEAISFLCKDNYFLSCICKQLSNSELSRLSGSLSDSKKYCKDLYIPLVKNTNDDFDVVLVVAPPQSGKTNYICNSFDNIMNKNGTAIFLRAKSIKQGIIQYIKNNIICLNSTTQTSEVIIKRLLSSTGIKIFIDGMNEVSRSERDDIVDDISRIKSQGVRFVISCTDTFVTTIKYDCNNNFSSIFKNDESNSFCEIKLPPFSKSNYKNVISHFQNVYKTSVEPKQKLSSINSVGKFYHLINSGFTAEKLDNEHKILDQILHEKCEIISQLELINCKSLLLYLANSMAESMNAIPSSSFCKELSGSPYSVLPDSFKNNGILEVCGNFVEFYDETYRDILLIEQYSETLSHRDTLNKLAGFINPDISFTCVFKYLCFYKIPTSIIFELDLDIQSRVLESIISYVRNSQLASTDNIRQILDMAVNGIENGFISEERAEELLYFLAEVCIDQPEITVDYSKTLYILGYISGVIEISNSYELEEHPYEFYSSQNHGSSIYHYIGKLFNDYIIEDHKMIFTREYSSDIHLALKLYDKNALKPLVSFFNNLIEHIFCYDSMMCSFGSYLNVEIDNYRESGTYETLVEAYQILLELKTLLSNTPTFDSLIEEIDGELQSSPSYEKIKVELAII